MHESLRKTEANYYPDLDQTKDSDLVSDRESSSSDDFIYVQKPKTNKFKCEA